MLSLISSAQLKVSGVVTSSDNGNPIPYVNIIGVESKVGTSTNMDGYYAIDIPSNETHLIFSALGYHQDTIAISGSTMDVIMNADHIIDI